MAGRSFVCRQLLIKQQILTRRAFNLKIHIISDGGGGVVVCVCSYVYVRDATTLLKLQMSDHLGGLAMSAVLQNGVAKVSVGSSARSGEADGPSADDRLRGSEGLTRGNF